MLVSALLVLPLMTSLGSQADAAEAKTLRIGVLVCLTGWFSTFDTLEWEEAQLARDMLNENGGITINGEKYRGSEPDDCRMHRHYYHS